MLRKLIYVLKLKPTIGNVLNLFMVSIFGILFVNSKFYNIPKNFKKLVRYQYIEIFIKRSLCHRNLKKDLSIDFVVDVGCSFGLSSIFLRDFFQVPVYSYDAVDHVLFRADGIHYKFGLIGKKTGAEHFQRRSNIESSSVQSVLKEDAKYELLRYVDLSHTLLDGSFFLKCDIEGSEYEFLKAYARELSRNCVAGFVECHNVQSLSVLVCKLENKIYRRFDFEIGDNKDGNVELSFTARKR